MPYTREFSVSEPPRETIDAGKQPLVLEFGTPWCGYCTAAQPLIEAAFQALPHIQHLKIEDGKGKALGRSFRVKLWPTLIFIRNGKEQERIVRPVDKDSIEEALTRIG